MRNILRIVDFLPVFYLVGSISIVATQHDQRLGDLAGGHARRARPLRRPALDRQVGAPVSVPLEQVLTWDVSAVDAEELRVLRHFLDRRLTLPVADPELLCRAAAGTRSGRRSRVCR